MKKHAKKINNKINTKKISIIIIVFLLIITGIVINKSNKIYKSDDLSLIIRNEDITKKLKNEIIIKDNIIYLSIDDIKQCIDKNIYQEDKKIITSSDKKVAVLELNSNNIEVNSAKLEIKGEPFKKEENIYLPISELKKVYDMNLEYIKEYKNIVIDFYSEKLQKAYLNKNLPIKTEKKLFSKITEKVNKGNWVIYVSEEGKWAKVRTQNGNLGYIKKKYLTNYVTEREEMSENFEQKDVNFEMNITKEKLEKYEQRKELIEKILVEAVNSEKNAVKIIYKKDNESIKKFKIEATAILKESGIAVVFEGEH